MKRGKFMVGSHSKKLILMSQFSKLYYCEFYVNFAQYLVFRDIFKGSGRQIDLQQLKLFIYIEMSSFNV